MTTTFHSTRSTTDSLTAKQAIRKGIADDGGLFVSDALGKTKVDVASLPGKSYQQIAAEVLGALLPDFTAEELGQCIADAYGEHLAAAGTADYKDIFVSCVFRLLRAAVHGEPFRLC